MNSQSQLLTIAWRIFRRDWRRGDLLVLIFAMCIAMASISVIYLTIDRIESATTREVADVLGADIVVSSPQKVPENWLAFADELKLEQATSVEFSSVLFANEKLQLASIKAVSDSYPLKGRLEIADSPYQSAKIINGKPPRGEVWVEPRLFSVLKVTKGQSLELGYSNLKVNGALMLQPGQGSTLFNIAPTAIMNIDDLPETKIIQPGSRVVYRYLFTGEPQALKQFAAKINSEKTTSQRLVTIFDESPVAGSAITRSKKYIGLSSLLTLILLGVAIAMSANRYARRQFDLGALMRCFGMTSNQVVSIFAYILLFVCVFGVVLGGIIGIGFQEVVIGLLARWMTEDLPQANYAALSLPVAATVIMLFGFSLPSLFRVKHVPPMRVLRRQLQPMKLSSWSIYIVSAITLVFVMWLQIGDIQLLMSVLAGLTIVAIVFAIIAGSLLRLTKSAARSQSAAVNFSLRQLNANKGISILHLLSFSITIFVIALIILVRTELMSKWQQSLGENIPNHFMVNVKPAEVETLKTFFNQNSLEVSGIYPMIRGRIVGINDEDIKTAVSEEGQRHNSLRRELNITWSDDLPIGNKVIEGEWNWPEKTDIPLISIEEKTAEVLGLELGDTLNFTIGSEPWSAKIVSVRSIDWQTFTPNFYIIASPGSLERFNSTYITSFFMPAERKALLADLVKEYPSVTVIELDRILEEVQGIISKVSRAVELIMIFVVVAGMALLWASMEHTFDAKYKQSAILRTLGASKKFIARSFRFEYLWLALLSSSMAVLAVELISYLLYQYVFEIPFEIHWLLWTVLPISALILMLLASWKGVEKVTNPSPLSLIRQG
ncbi:ABC transporter permease [Aliikangiella coralliicola]|uniref:FtsX-like permease family protein n=1 Tax=Aliikangiella coralliicola TaxID=2592383 RepID=A0A545TWH8_9GAMM|nr:FtsX-like permease family protein [Aliikangiella coralliicola]TQV81570.1 FtsX-like permease family protein [Aliikangiella coralliicola]